jgi:NADH-quinone oxidoreductase subunit M
MPYLLTILLLLPVAGTLALVLYSFASSRREEHYRWIALITTVATFVASLLLLRGTGGGAEFRFEENVTWIGFIGSRYHIAVDGISLWLVLLTTLLMPISVLSSWTAVRKRQLSYYAFLLILESALIGVVF